jgi:hypothetical protein
MIYNPKFMLVFRIQLYSFQEICYSSLPGHCFDYGYLLLFWVHILNKFSLQQFILLSFVKICMSIIQFYRIVLQFSEALFYVLNANFKFKMLTRAPVVCKNVLSVSDDNKTCGFPYHIIDQNKQQNMWVFCITRIH